MLTEEMLREEYARGLRSVLEKRAQAAGPATNWVDEYAQNTNRFNNMPASERGQVTVPREHTSRAARWNPFHNSEQPWRQPFRDAFRWGTSDAQMQENELRRKNQYFEQLAKNRSQQAKDRAINAQSASYGLRSDFDEASHANLRRQDASNLGKEFDYDIKKPRTPNEAAALRLQELYGQPMGQGGQQGLGGWAPHVGQLPATRTLAATQAHRAGGGNIPAGPQGARSAMPAPVAPPASEYSLAAQRAVFGPSTFPGVPANPPLDRGPTAPSSRLPPATQPGAPAATGVRPAPGGAPTTRGGAQPVTPTTAPLTAIERYRQRDAGVSKPPVTAPQLPGTPQIPGRV